MFDFFLQLEPQVIALFLFAVMLTLLLLIAIVLLVSHTSKMDRMADPIYEHAIEKARARANEIVGSAMDQARELRVEGELKGIKAVAQNKVSAKKLLTEYEETLEELAAQTKQYIQTRGVETAASYESLSKSLEAEMRRDVASLREAFKEGNEAVTQSLAELKALSDAAKATHQKVATKMQEEANQRVAQIADRLALRGEEVIAELESRLTNMHDALRKEVSTRISAALDEVENEVRTYKQKRLAIIDRDLAGVVEHVAAAVLGKKLSLDEHADLAKRALADAGANGVFDDTSNKASAA